MRVPSISSTAVRRAPQQDRAARRVMAFLEAGEALIAELGYEGTTMTAVAARAGSSIGALYSYFPDKVALAHALLHQYPKQIQDYWQPVFEDIEKLSAQEFAERFLERFLAFAHQHPAYLQLLNAPIKFRRDPAARLAFRKTLVQALQLRVKGCSQEQALLYTNVILQISKGMMALYAEASTADKPRIVAEFEQALGGYLKHVFSD